MKVPPAVIFVLFSISCSAQEYKKLKVGIGLGLAKISGSDVNGSKSHGGILACFEPSYRIKDNVSVGVRLETLDGWVNVASYGINGQYYFSNKNFRPFAGIGIGFYHPRLSSIIFYGYSSRLETTVFGFYPRVGFDWKHLSLVIDWNIAAPSKAIINPSAFTLPAYTGYISSNYLSTKLVLVIGGGRKKQPK